MSNRHVFWSVTPDYTDSPYIRDIARFVEATGWRISPLKLRDVSAASKQIVHIQWPEHVTRGQSKIATLAKNARALAMLGAIEVRGHIVVLTAHNRQPHQEFNAFDSWFRKALQKRAVATVVLVDEHEAELRASGAISPSSIARSIPHPVLPQTASPAQPALSAQSERQSERRGLVLLGKVHPYHQIGEFVAALESQDNSRPVLIAGGVADQQLFDDLTEAAGRLDWLTFRPGFQSDESLDPHLATCAAFVSLQRNPFNSGAPYHALGLNLPVVVSTGAQADHLARNAGQDWVFAVPEDVSELDLAELDAWLERDRTTPSLDYFDAERVGTLHVELYEDVLAKTFNASK